MASVSQVAIASGSSQTNRNVSQINDSLYLFYKPPADTPNVQILFFHGLQRGRDYSNAHVSTWENRDGSCIWPQTWLVEEFPRAHVLSVSYTEGLKRGSRDPALRARVFACLVLLALVSSALLGLPSFVTLFVGLGVLLLWQFKTRERASDGSVDMYITGENLLSDLLQANIGSSCPVVLVGHSIGGLVIKHLCEYAHAQLRTTREPEKTRLTAFLNSIKGIFFYSTPHQGSAVIASRLKQNFGSHLMEYFEILSTSTSRLNFAFDQISKQHYKWVLAGLGETLPTNMGPFQEIVVVEEASARGTVDNFYSVPGADHFSICRPEDKLLASFGKLATFIGDIVNDLKEDNERLPLPFIHDPKYVELKMTLIKVKEALESKTAGRVVTLSGASGEGKTSMARHLALYYQNARQNVDRSSPDGVQDEELGTENSASRSFRDGVVFLTCSSNEVSISPLLELWKRLGYDLLPLMEAESGNASSSSGIRQESLIPERVLEDALNKKIRAQKVLIILDDVHDSALIQKFLRIVGESLKFLITTQNREIWADRNCKQIPIGTPTSEEACHILLNHAYGRHADITQPTQDAIDAIVEQAARHPLVLANVAACIEGESHNEEEQWENASKYFQELVFEEPGADKAVLYDEMYPRTVAASMKLTLSTLSKWDETKTLLLLASTFESESIPEVVFKLFVKRRYGRLGKFSTWSKRLEYTNFIRVDFTTDSWTTASGKTWFLHPLRQRFIERIEESEVKSMVEGILECRTDDDDIAVIVLLIIYGRDKWRKKAAKALAIPTPQFQNGSVQSWSLHLARIKSFVGLIHVDPGRDWEKRSDGLAKQILHKYVYCHEVDDDCVSILLSVTQTYTHTLKALSNFFALNFSQIFLPKTVTVVLNLLELDNSTTLATNALATNALLRLSRGNEERIGQLPNSLEKLVALLADGEALQLNAAAVLAILTLDAENKKKIGQLPNALERLVALLADNVSETTQSTVALVLTNLALDDENQKKIGQLPNALERLVALLANNVNKDTQESAARALASLTLDDENKKKIGQLPNAVERLVALLAADSVSQTTQHTVVLALANLALDDENQKKIGQVPNALERLVALLTNHVSEATPEMSAYTPACALANLAMDAQNRKSIAQLPNALERLVALLADNVSNDKQQNAARALGYLALDAENEKRIGQLPNALERLVALLADNVSKLTQENAVHALSNLVMDVENKEKIGQLPNALERLIALLANNTSEVTQAYATLALANLALDPENKKKIGQLPNALERLVALMADNVIEATQLNAIYALVTLAVDEENEKKIGQLPNALERLVALMADNASKATQLSATILLASLSMDAENKKKIGQLPNALERLVALLAENVSEATQRIAAGALANLAKDKKNQKNIGQRPNSMERLVALLANNVDKGTQENAARALANLGVNAQNRIKIGQFPVVFERLVILLGEGERANVRSNAGFALRYLSLEGHRREHEGALEAYEDDRVANDPRHCLILTRRCSVKAKRGDYEGALTDINKFNALGRDRPYGLQERGIVRKMKGDLDGALADMNDSLSLQPDDYECLKHRGLVKFLLLDEDGARADAECALRVKPARVDTNQYGTGFCLGASSVEYLGYNLK